ncbi:MAG TPA: poly-gamma-glutamate biosynthesis protein PgsC/CapC [Candidatus Limnocylindria bacterium]|nr:poly-gamma-glutamate biosynthesis protein PgsC/CapC [Candidatus Limnocylindria bacterium]
MIQAAVLFSVLISFASGELLGVFTGGLVTAGYLAFHILSPLRLLSTFAAALLTYGAVALMGRYLLVFGRRRYMLCVLLGMFAGWALTEALPLAALPAALGVQADLRVIGYIVPGLIANDMARQGPLKTVLGTLLAAALVRLLLMLLFGV